MKKEKQPHGGEIRILEKGETANPNGRPKKLVGSLISSLKEEGYEAVTNTQIAEIISLLLNLDKEKVKELAEDSTQPIYIQRTARRLYTASDKEIGDFIDKQLDRAHGKAKQAIDHTSGGEKIMGPMESLSPERQAEILRLLKKDD